MSDERDNFGKMNFFLKKTEIGNEEEDDVLRKQRRAK